MRNFEEILQSIVDKKNQQLPMLNSTSLVAIWYIWANVVALAIYTFEQIFYKEKADLEKYAKLQRYGTLPWWVPQVLYFQLGDPLIYNSATGIHYYATIDDSKKIIKRVAVLEVGGTEVLIKVAKIESGEFVKLNPSELNSATTYIDEIKPAGTLVTVLSIDADILDSVADVYYDGTYLLSDIKTLINDILLEFKSKINYQNINGKILKNELIDSLRESTAINDIYFSILQAKPYGGDYTDITREYSTNAGYFNYIANMVDNWNYIPVNNNSTL